MNVCHPLYAYLKNTQTSLRVILLVTLVVTLCPLLNGQAIIGDWHEAQYNLNLRLNPDGTFQFSGPYGQSAGLFQVQGSYLYVQDQTGQILQYAIQRLDERHLHLYDAYGVAINYTRVTAASSSDSGRPRSGNLAQDQSGNMLSGTLASVGNGKVVATSGGQSLYAGDIQTGVDIVQFVIGHAITGEETRQMSAAAIEEFKEYPREFKRQVESLNQSLNKLRSLSDPMQVGAMRQALIVEFYKVSLNVPEAEMPLTLKLIKRYNPVLAFDPAAGLALTRQDVDSLIQYIRFANSLAGIDREITESEQTLFHSELVRTFPLMGGQQKQFLCSAGVMWKLVKANWDQMTSQEQNQVKQSYAQSLVNQYGSGAQTVAADGWGAEASGAGVSATQYPSGSGTPSQAEMSRMMREHNARQNMFQMMNNMSLQHHATMLNTIENFGGTGNYWEVVPSTY